MKEAPKKKTQGILHFHFQLRIVVTSKSNLLRKSILSEKNGNWKRTETDAIRRKGGQK